MSGPTTIDKTKRTTPCSPGCRHPMCVALRDGLPWCEACRSWHAMPRDAAHHAALKCKAEPPENERE